MENWKRPLERLLCRHVGGCDFPPEGLESRSVFKWLYEEGMNSLFQTKYKKISTLHENIEPWMVITLQLNFNWISLIF